MARDEDTGEEQTVAWRHRRNGAVMPSDLCRVPDAHSATASQLPLSRVTAQQKGGPVVGT